MQISDFTPTFEGQSFSFPYWEHPISLCDFSGANEQMAHMKIVQEPKGKLATEQPVTKTKLKKKKYVTYLLWDVGSYDNGRQ